MKQLLMLEKYLFFQDNVFIVLISLINGQL